MRFFLDHCVPAGVAVVLTNAGHEVIIQKDAIPTDSSDTLVAIASAVNEAILVSFDKDFKTIAARTHITHRQLKKLSRIQFRCKAPQAAIRLQIALPFIAMEWGIVQSLHDARMFVDIGDSYVRFNR
jgi:predicted nuclease of predicted toxin-antitoxin system